MTDDPTIASIETYPLQEELPGRGYGASKNYAASRVCTLVKVTTSDGVVGWGESFGPPQVTAGWFAQFVPELLGTSIHAMESFILSKLQTAYVFGKAGAHISALSGIDIAVWDARARTGGTSVASLFGGIKRRRVEAYASTGYFSEDWSFDEFRGQMESAASEGFTAVKIKIGSGADDDWRRASIAREVFGDEATLMVDYNGSGTPDVIRRSLNRVRELDLHWVEEPLPPEDDGGWQRIQELGVPVSAGEALYTRFGFRDPIAQRRWDIMQPDVTRCGGFTEVKAISTMATTWNVRLQPHCWGTGVAQAAVLQILAALPDSPYGVHGSTKQMLEFDRGPHELREAVLVEPVSQVEGWIDIPDGPGLGVDVDEDRVEKLYLRELAVRA